MATDASAPPPKYSRYRSVRRANTVESSPANATPKSPDDASSGSIQRSMSRYRRPKTMTQEHAAIAPPLPTTQRGETIGERLFSNGTMRSQTQPSGTRPVGRELGNTGLQIPRQHIPPPSPEPPEQLSAADEEERLRRAHERMQQQRLARQKTEEEEAERILAEQKRKDLERLEAQLEAAGPRPVSPPLRSTKDKFKIFSRKRSATRTTPPSSSGTTRENTERSPPHEPPMPIMHGGGGIVPGIDAPVSAVNAGERRILVRCKQASINLPVTPTTTARELIYSAANVLTNSVSPDAAVLIESYTTAGLERRIRRYEHIRDILNSWDRDTQHAVILESSDSPKHDFDVIAAYAPKERPGTTTVHMYHSQKPGRWVKCHITLLPTGQIFISRKSAGNPAAKDAVTICHLSDFDIYTPTAPQLRKLKPPKRHCHAIKSQQKATMFLSTENFVHFFSTDDKHVADAWYDAVQAWRSWYLIHQIGQGKGKAKSTSGSARSPPQDDPYTIGSFKPLGISTSSVASAADDDDTDKPRQIPFHLRHSIHPSLSLSPPPPSDHPRAHPPPAPAPFASSSLLGRSYSQRRAALDRNPESQGNPDFSAGPFIAGPSLLNAAPPLPPMPVEADEGAKVVRALSTRTVARDREKPQPLLDFTPAFREAPQWRGKGGRGVQAPSGVLLVEVAGTKGEEGVGAGAGDAVVFRRERAGTVRGERT